MTDDKTIQAGPYTSQWSDKEAGYVITGPTEDGTYAMSEGSANVYAMQLNAAFRAGQASQQRGVELSKDYEKLYDHLCGGGEAICRWPDGMGGLNVDHACVMRGVIVAKDAFLQDCKWKRIEWVAPTSRPPSVSVDQIMEVVINWRSHWHLYIDGQGTGPHLDFRDRMTALLNGQQKGYG